MPLLTDVSQFTLQDLPSVITLILPSLISSLADGTQDYYWQGFRLTSLTALTTLSLPSLINATLTLNYLPMLTTIMTPKLRLIASLPPYLANGETTSSPSSFTDVRFHYISVFLRTSFLDIYLTTNNY
jgi:hypothetical protein